MPLMAAFFRKFGESIADFEWNMGDGDPPCPLMGGKYAPNTPYYFVYAAANQLG